MDVETTKAVGLSKSQSTSQKSDAYPTNSYAEVHFVEVETVKCNDEMEAQLEFGRFWKTYLSTRSNFDFNQTSLVSEQFLAKEK